MVAVEKSSLWNLIKDVKPSDLSIVHRDVPPETVDAMKRTVSGILGLLPSDKYLDQLGMASKYNTKVFCRRTLIRGNYGLLDTKTFLPILITTVLC
ncbi:hypothetical protein VPH35_060636 [Triticum aestivum]